MSLLSKFKNNSIPENKKEQRNKEIMNCNTLNEMLFVLGKYHQFDKELGPVKKIIIRDKVLPKLDKAFKTLGI